MLRVNTGESPAPEFSLIEFAKFESVVALGEYSKVFKVKVLESAIPVEVIAGCSGESVSSVKDGESP